MFVPAVTGLAGPVLLTVTSAEITLSLKELLSLAVLDSVVLVLMTALLVMVPPVAVTNTVTVALPVAPAASVPRVKVTCPAPSETPPPVALTKLTPLGSVSTNCTFWAAAVPGLA